MIGPSGLVVVGKVLLSIDVARAAFLMRAVVT